MSEFSIKPQPVKLMGNKKEGSVIDNSYVDIHEKKYSISRRRRKEDERTKHTIIKKSW